MPRILIDSTTDAAIEKELPDRFGGPRKAKLRIMEVVAQWLASNGAAKHDKRPARRSGGVRAGVGRGKG